VRGVGGIHEQDVVFTIDFRCTNVSIVMSKS